MPSFFNGLLSEIGATIEFKKWSKSFANSESSPEGRGYFELSRLVGVFADTFDNVKDVSNTLDRLVNKELIEVNTRSTKTVSGASHVRVTAAGWYYFRYLSGIFAYLDLILQDTPFNDEKLESDLRQSVYDVNNLADPEKEKYERMQVRFDRTQRFLDYLTREEEMEFEIFDLWKAPGKLSAQFTTDIQTRFKEERAYIEQRLQQGRLVDAPDEPDEGYAAHFELNLDEGEDSHDTLNSE